MNNPDFQVDAVGMMRDIRDQLGREIQDLSHEQVLEHIRGLVRAVPIDSESEQPGGAITR
ncbi:MAG TPA: hypothetical protein VF665_10250 [Longimicrobium sp.]|jgi:hypothetical protein|uniref:hypothetical protein n=1 Tax=Longimicrobium sp. TaxID=2029185 RepID=UPI002ED9CF8B